VATLRPDAVLTDIRMPPSHHMEGIDAALTIRSAHPDVGVVVLSQHSDEVYAFELFKEGTAGLAYLLKERLGDLDELTRALREVGAGRSVIDPAVVEALVGRRVRQQSSLLHRLTPREMDVLRAMAEGKRNSAIGAELALSGSAIEKHVNAIFTKLDLGGSPDVDRRVSAVLRFLNERNGH
jgi:DNA-binding NarL/FixJ family response regulator